MPDSTRLENQALNLLLLREAQYSKEIQDQLQELLKQIQGEMKSIYDKYAVNGKIDKTIMVKYGRYQAMEKSIMEQLEPTIRDNVKVIKEFLPSQFEESFYHYAWAIDMSVKANLVWGLVNTKPLLAIFDITNPKNLELVEALHNYGPEAKKRIRSALLNGLSIGKNYETMARDLRKQLDKIYSSALTIVRTEGQSALNAGATIAFQRALENGVKGKEVWMATKDDKTRYTHGMMDEVERSDDGYFHGAIGQALYPGDLNLPAGERINCRCNISFKVEGYDETGSLMRTREEGVIPFLTYTDYIEQYHPEWKKNWRIGGKKVVQ